MRELHDLDRPPASPEERPEKKESSGKILQASNIASYEGIKQAMREGLRKSYPDGSLKGPLTTVTTRLPAEICQRLEWASALTSSKKQEVITEALRLYFEKVANEEG
jgi:hypothetical protein